MFYVENYVGCTLAIGNVKQACTAGFICQRNVVGYVDPGMRGKYLKDDVLILNRIFNRI
jgi:hypothetical protein